MVRKEILFLCMAGLAYAENSDPTGQWYLNANHYALSATITSPTQGIYVGTLINENGGTEVLDNISWNAPSRTMQFRRDGAGFYQWYLGTVVEGVFAGRFSSGSAPSQPPLTSYTWHVTA